MLKLILFKLSIPSKSTSFFRDKELFNNIAVELNNKVLFLILFILNDLTGGDSILFILSFISFIFCLY